MNKLFSVSENQSDLLGRCHKSLRVQAEVASADGEDDGGLVMEPLGSISLLDRTLQFSFFLRKLHDGLPR